MSANDKQKPTAQIMNSTQALSQSKEALVTFVVNDTASELSESHVLVKIRHRDAIAANTCQKIPVLR